MSDQPDDPVDLRWHPSRHYDTAMAVLQDPGGLSPIAVDLAIAHFLGGLLKLEMDR